MSIEGEWTHSKTGNVYTATRVIRTNVGEELVLYHPVGLGYDRDWALHTERKNIVILDAVPWLLNPGSNCVIKVEGSCQFARPLAMWEERTPHGPRFKRRT